MIPRILQARPVRYGLRAALSAALATTLGACAEYAPPPSYGNVMVLGSDEAARMSGSPPPGTTWRLDERELKLLSPAPIVPAPPPPRIPPPRPGEYGYPPGPGWYGPAY